MQQTQDSPLFRPFRLGAVDVPNLVVMAPMTRSRSDDAGVPPPFAAAYYAQRASAGLIVSEATNVSPQACGYALTPGIWAPAQVEAWRAVTRTVHAQGGRMVLQLWHTGRISHPSLHSGALPVAPSAIRPEGQAFTNEGLQDHVTPRALETDEIPAIVADYRHAAGCAREAGFDGVEIHSANNDLLEQFIRDSTNRRTDRYGGGIEHRVRFPLEVVDAVSAAIGRGRVGIRLSPWGMVNGTSHFDGLEATFLALGVRGIAYVHVMDQSGLWNLPDPMDPVSDQIVRLLRRWRLAMPRSALMLAGGMTRDRADALIGEGVIALAGFGQPFIANPDLVARLRHGWPLASPDCDTYYTGGPRGYIDYPPYAQGRAEHVPALAA